MRKIIICSIVSIVILAFIFVCFKFFTKPENKIKVTDILIGKTYEVKQGKTVRGVKIIRIEDTKVIVKHLDNIKECEYNKTYDFWPDSQGGNIMWQAPQARLIFEKIER